MNKLVKKRDESAREVIAIIGTGNYGIAIGKRLLDYGYEIVYGSRTPNKTYLNESFKNSSTENTGHQAYSVTTPPDAWNKSTQIVIFAVSAHEPVYESLVNQVITENYSNQTSKIVIEISNLLDTQDTRNLALSNAEKLQSLFDEKLKKRKSKTTAAVHVVKGFNLLSAYSISSSLDENLDKEALTSGYNKLIPIAGNEKESKAIVIDMCDKIGFKAYDIGPLSSARKLELANKKTFSEWYIPSLISIVWFLFNEIWVFVHYFYLPKPEKRSQTWRNYLDEFSLLSHTNKVLGFTSLQILAFVYFAYIVASCFQLCYGTKYQKFPRALDFWMRTRKQFDLWAFLFGLLHTLASGFIIDKAYLKDWYLVDAKGNTTILGLNGDLSLMTGMLALALFTIVALTSINSIANSLNFGEWTFVQSKLGLACLSVATLHTLIMYARIFMEKEEKKWDSLYLVSRVKLVAAFFPLVVLLARLVYALPPFSKWLEQIRNGASVKSHADDQTSSNQTKPF